MKNFRKIATCLLAVLAISTSCKKDVESVDITPATVSLKVGETTKLTADVKPSKADYTLTWSSSNPAIATVDNSGSVKAIAEGKATITAKAGNKEGACVVTVESAPDPSDGLSDGEISVTFGAAHWKTTNIEAANFTAYDAVAIMATTGDFDDYPAAFPLIDIGIENKVGSAEVYYLEYFEKTFYYDNQYNIYPEWEAEYDLNPTFTITAFGNGKISGNATVTMCDFWEKYEEQKPNYTTKNIEVAFKNVNMQAAKSMINGLAKRSTQRFAQKSHNIPTNLKLSAKK